MRLRPWTTGRSGGWPAALLAVQLAAIGLVLSLAPGWAARQIDDPGIVAAVERALRLAPTVPDEDIEVDAEEGIVRLEGTVPDLVTREVAGNAAGTVRGVRAVENALQVVPRRPIPPELLASEVLAALETLPRIERLDIAIDVEPGGVVHLSGVAGTWGERELAAQWAMRVDGVTALTNDITVVGPGDVADAQIEAAVEQRLRWSVLVDDTQIEAKVAAGVVRLVGIVGSVAERSMAESLAHVPGVVAVDASGLEVGHWTRSRAVVGTKYDPVTADAVAEAVGTALRYEPRIGAGSVVVTMDGTTAILDGSVETVGAQRAASRRAAEVVGVTQVINRLEVRPRAPLTDAVIAAAIREALARDLSLADGSIQATVTTGVVFLEGTVGTVSEKARAEELVVHIPGVMGVDNALAVTGTGRRLTVNPYRDRWTAAGYAWASETPPDPPTRTVDDAKILMDVIDELWWSPFVDSEDVHVAVENGVVTLTGTVDTRSEWLAAQENARDGGALRVVNALEVAPRPAN